MNGYWHRGTHSPAIPVQREQKESSPWLVTQDLGCWDEMGRLYYCGRASDVIRTGSESVLATEVERVLEQLPWIQECAVVGLPHDAKWGELVCAAIVLRNHHYDDNNDDAQSVLLDRIRQHCTQKQLAGYKKPKQVYSLQKLPRNSSGKLLKHQLIKQLLVLQRQQQNEEEKIQINRSPVAIRSKL
jgi:fatty-acyl-CoA synthase